MTVISPVTAGDANIERTVQLGDSDTDGTFSTVDFTGTVASVAVEVRSKDDPSVTGALTGAFAAESTGTLTVGFGDDTGWLATLVQVGVDRVWELRYTVTFNDGTVETWGPDEIPVLGS